MSIGAPIPEIVSVAVIFHARVPFDYTINKAQDVVFESGREVIDLRLIVESDAVTQEQGRAYYDLSQKSQLLQGLLVCCRCALNPQSCPLII